MLSREHSMPIFDGSSSGERAVSRRQGSSGVWLFWVSLWMSLDDGSVWFLLCPVIFLSIPLLPVSCWPASLSDIYAFFSVFPNFDKCVGCLSFLWALSDWQRNEFSSTLTISWWQAPSGVICGLISDAGAFSSWAEQREWRWVLVIGCSVRFL